MVALSFSKEGSLHAEDVMLAPTLDVLARVVRPPLAVDVLISRRLRCIRHMTHLSQFLHSHRLAAVGMRRCLAADLGCLPGRMLVPVHMSDSKITSILWTLPYRPHHFRRTHHGRDN
jgi:hypothetical protein